MAYFKKVAGSARSGGAVIVTAANGGIERSQR